MLVDQYLSKRLNLEDQELEVLKYLNFQRIRDYSEGVLKVPEGSERGIYKLFQLRHFPKLEPYISIEVKILIIKKKILGNFLKM